MSNREKRVEIFQDTEKVMKEKKILAAAIINSINQTKVYVSLEEGRTDVKETACAVVVSKDRSFAAAEKYHRLHPEDKIAVLNFASATNPGGGVKAGSSAQEEALCRCSTLYPALTTKMVYESFYKYHKAEKNVLYSDMCIYTPDIVVFKTDTDEPVLKAEEDWAKVDIITCAAPNLRPIPYNKMNPGSGEASKITQKELLILLKKRTEQIFNVAAKNNVDALILGAFGCGAFCNPPEVVARAFKESLEKYKYCFKYVEFAVYCKATETINYDVFNRNFSRC
ncbi:TIGR02452 family protein [Lacrimispora amygdalina]|uniref:TIGR02452 family protein n=1 Tax=Lacrimispora amygdalina TaxID=253257 RepID=UPI000BE41875|nr:TIGR02452 family protein [Lacrimispora amygdalina]